MSRRRYAAVLFDMFDTLVRLDRCRLPLLRIGERELRSSAGVLHGIAAAALPGVGLERFVEAFHWSYQEAERRRAVDHREVCAADRVRLCYGRLGLDPGRVPADLTERLLAAHMRCLAGSAQPMPGSQALLAWLDGRYLLGLVSNFDYTPTVERILHEMGMAPRFATVLVSDRVGWRKPHAAIFAAACRALAVDPAECLFVGDRLDVDVAGAKALGMGAAWLNPERAPLADGATPPDFDLAALGELRPVLLGEKDA